MKHPKSRNVERKPDPNPGYVPCETRAEFITIDGKRVPSCGMDGMKWVQTIRDAGQWGRK